MELELPANPTDIDNADPEELREACRALQRELERLDRFIRKRAEALTRCGLDYCDNGSEITLDIIDRDRAAAWFRDADDEAATKDDAA